MSDPRLDDERTDATADGDESQGAPDAAEGPLVPPDLVPQVEVPAAGKPAPLWKSLGVAAIVVLVIGAAAAFLIVRANTVWSTRAMVETGLKGAEALVEGDADTLAALSTPTVQNALTPKVRADMKQQGALVTFTAPEWSGDSAFVGAMVGPSAGRMTVLPDGQNADTVDFATTGSLGKARGAFQMERDWYGWKISGVTVVPQS